MSYDDKWPAYQLFGLVLASDFHFVSPLNPTLNPVDLTFTCDKYPPVPIKWKDLTPIYESSNHAKAEKIVARFYQLDTCEVLRFTDFADFYLWPEEIVCHLLDRARDYMVEIYVLGSLLSLLLEKQGVPTLHASAVVVDGRGIAFLSGNFAGKSTLAATLMQAGCPLLTDDVLPVECDSGVFFGRSSYPQMRLWPDEAQHFLAHCRNLPRVSPVVSKRRLSVGSRGFGTFCNTAHPLSCIYLPERHDPTEEGMVIKITPVSPRNSMIELMCHSFTPRIVEALGLQPQRLEFFARLVQQVTVRRLRYPSGFEYLPHVRDAILEDLANLPERASVGRP